MLKIQKPSGWIDEEVKASECESCGHRQEKVEPFLLLRYLDALHAELNETLEKLSQTTGGH